MTQAPDLRALDPGMHKALMENPALQGLGLSPEAATSWAMMGRKGGESVDQALQRFTGEVGRARNGVSNGSGRLMNADAATVR